MTFRLLETGMRLSFEFVPLYRGGFLPSFFFFFPLQRTAFRDLHPVPPPEQNTPDPAKKSGEVGQTIDESMTACTSKGVVLDGLQEGEPRGSQTTHP